MKTDPIFIVEDNCSGSNYLATLIAKHPDIGIAPESNFILDLMYHFRNRVLKSQKDIDEAIAVIFRSKISTHKSEVDFSAFGINSTQLKSFLNSALPATVPDIVNFILSQYCRKHFPGCSTWGVKKAVMFLNWINWFAISQELNLSTLFETDGLSMPPKSDRF
jgi:hypothetical protein